LLQSQAASGALGSVPNAGLFKPGTPRVVSLIASATEIVHALGCGDWLVGRSHECDFPPEVVALPPCSAAKVDVYADSREIDRQVKSAVAEGRGVYRLESDRLEDLAPTVVLTQNQCDVCAVSLSDVEATVCEFGALPPQIVSLQPDSLADVWEDFRRVGRALGVETRAERLVADCESRLAALSQRCLKFERARPHVACIEWIEPLMAAGNWMPELVERVGGRNLFGIAGRHSPWMTWDELVAADPDVIALMPCGFDIPRAQSELHWLTHRSEWPALRAVRENRVFVTDGNQYFNRPGPRLVESAEILAEVLYPGRFDFGHHGRGWVKMES
jgi:iron complex transport system substrate-binding protein